LQSQLCADDIFVEFDNSLNVAVRKLREALRDDADNPRFLETIRDADIGSSLPSRFVRRRPTGASPRRPGTRVPGLLGKWTCYGSYAAQKSSDFGILIQQFLE
jgi:hypothetical protein